MVNQTESTLEPPVQPGDGEFELTLPDAGEGADGGIAALRESFDRETDVLLRGHTQPAYQWFQ